MTINPRDYDLDELRKMARKRGAAESTADAVSEGEADVADPNVEWTPLENEGSAGDDAFRARIYRELMPLAAGSDSLSRPYLDALPETPAAEYLVFEWLEFLLMHGGFRGAQNALNYYEDVGWLTENVTSDLRDYLLGIDEEGPTDASDLDADDHLLSLVYVAKIESMR
jgi:flagellar protein FlaE